MPSMHIGMACWLALSLRSYFPKMQWAGWAYMATIWLSSIHLGWHYASDGIGGVIGALLVWRAAGAIAGFKFNGGQSRFQAEAAAVD
jgi:membrane-associated phospholipid phosphatase